jgi:hypothetical protein
LRAWHPPWKDRCSTFVVVTDVDHRVAVIAVETEVAMRPHLGAETGVIPHLARRLVEDHRSRWCREIGHVLGVPAQPRKQVGREARTHWIEQERPLNRVRLDLFRQIAADIAFEVHGDFNRRVPSAEPQDAPQQPLRPVGRIRRPANERQPRSNADPLSKPGCRHE